jgi:hypothetical protein
MNAVRCRFDSAPPLGGHGQVGAPAEALGSNSFDIAEV